MRASTLVLLALIVIPAAAPAAPFDSSALRCETTVAKRLRVCLKDVNATVASCYAETNAACARTEARIAAALDELAVRIREDCPPAAVPDAGYGPLFDAESVIARATEVCLGEASTLAARTFGGPQAAVLSFADAGGRECLAHAFKEGARLVERTYKTASDCVRKAHRGAACDASRVAIKMSNALLKTSDKVARACPMLPALIGLDGAAFAERAAAQGRCVTATAHGDTVPVSLDCGPRASVPVPARGAAVQVVLNNSTWGTRCGDGTSYAFWLRLAPQGRPLDRVVVHMQGGGSCASGPDCAGRPADLFQALDDSMPTAGHFSNDANLNPFADWTKVFLPYCTQDIHIGGGITNNYPEITVRRYGARNVRAALRYVRDVLWSALDADDPEGFRPDRLTVFFGGTSAGGWGTSLNYHYVLDDLRWIHATAVPDAGLGLDSGTQNEFPPDWAAAQYVPPYCYTGGCGSIPELQALTSVRLKATPEQQFLIVSNQVDSTQRSTQGFTTMTAFINALRAAYCANKGLPGLRYFLPASSASIHGMLNKNTTFPSMPSAGASLGAWLADAFADPDAVVDRVEEGTLVADYGATPFSCPLD